jgi:putative sigma-54 modulation protein
MQLEFSLKNVPGKSEGVKVFLEEKTSKLEKFFQGKIHARWVISYENEEHVCHLRVTGNHIEFFGEARDHNLYSGIEEAIDRIERQLVKHKEIVKDHHR